jgi:hypothetical protein
MARKKGLPAGELSRRENRKFNDLRNNVGVEGVRDKETRAIKRWMKTHRA